MKQAVQDVFENVDDLKKFTAKEVENLKKASNKERIEMIKQLLRFTKGATLTSKDADVLEEFETENDQRSWTRHV